MKITIETVDNGFILKKICKEDPSESETRVLEGGSGYESDVADLKAHRALCWEMMELLGIVHSRKNNHLEIRILNFNNEEIQGT